MNVKENLQRALDKFTEMSGWTPTESDLSSRSVANLNDRDDTPVNVINLLDIQEGTYNVTAMTSSCNPNIKGTVVVSEDSITFFSDMSHNGTDLTNSWVLEDLFIDGERYFFPVLALGEYPIFVDREDTATIQLRLDDINLDLVEAPVVSNLEAVFEENKELNAEIEGCFVYVEGVGLGFEEKALINNKF